MKYIQLSRGYRAIVDDEDYERVSKWIWTYAPNAGDKVKYAVTQIITACCGTRKRIKLHRFIMDAKPGQEVDHINADGLDNRKSNLRFCSRAQNLANKKKMSGNRKYKGVAAVTGSSKWQANIGWKKKRIYLGCFNTQEEAARAYDDKAMELYGEFARFNLRPSGVKNDFKN